MTNKRSREELEFERSIAMANYLILLSQGSDTVSESQVISRPVFECKTCKKQFSSFQALGGHRASHKKPKLSGDVNYISAADRMDENVVKPKIHECSICGLEFGLGQALGGHMRRHRAALTESRVLCRLPSLTLSLGTSKSLHQVKKKDGVNQKKLVCLDLNLSPENGLLEVRKVAPAF